jgi:large subunit ribosomal protein L2
MINKTRKLRNNGNSSRRTVFIDKRDLWKGGPEKTLTRRLKNTGGRNNYGRVTCVKMSGGHKRVYRDIDFIRTAPSLSVIRIEYDPIRTTFIALAEDKEGKKYYVLAPEGLNEEDTILSARDGSSVEPRLGNCLKLDDMPMGTIIHNIELIPGQGGQLARAAGGSAVLVGKEMGFALVRLPSQEVRRVPLDCYATVGILSNGDWLNKCWGKAGARRNDGVKPRSRRTKTNPVDHLHGGECRRGNELVNKGGRHGYIKKFVPTRRDIPGKGRKRSSQFIASERPTRRSR